MSNNNQMTTQSTKAVAQRPVELLKSMLNEPSVQAQFANALREHKDSFVASIIDLYTGDKQLQMCKPSDVICQALKAATMKLPINKALGFAYIVVYNNFVKTIDPATGREVRTKVPTPTFMPGYKGYIQLAMRTGQYRTINADVVYEGELKSIDKLSGTIDFGGEKISDNIVGYFCHFELLNGFKKTLFMPLKEMAAYAKRYSPSIGANTSVDDLIGKANSGQVSKQVGWLGNFNEMALKTVIKRLLSRYGYLSVEMQGALAGEVEDESLVNRNDLINEDANETEFNIAEVSYEVVDTANADKSPKAEKADEEPGY